MSMIRSLVSLLSLLLMAGLIAACGEAPVNEPVGVSESALSQNKTTLCHIPPGNPANAHTISVGNSAVKAHLAHGDSLDACGGMSCIGEDDGPCTSNRECCSGLACDADGLCNPQGV